ncbi:MAG: ATP synthase subunit I [Woeseia sp.]
MRSFVALHQSRHYNARAKHKPAWTDNNQDATHRRSADGRGVFNAGGLTEMTAGAGREAASTAHPIVRVLMLQLCLGAATAVIFWGTVGYVSGYSALLGGLACVLPNAFLALRLVVPRRDPGAGGLVRAAYIGELGKLVLTVLMFGAIFTLIKPLAPLALFVGFIAAQLATFAGFLLRDNE